MFTKNRKAILPFTLGGLAAGGLYGYSDYEGRKAEAEKIREENRKLFEDYQWQKQEQEELQHKSKIVGIAEDGKPVTGEMLDEAPLEQRRILKYEDGKPVYRTGSKKDSTDIVPDNTGEFIDKNTNIRYSDSQGTRRAVPIDSNGNRDAYAQNAAATTPFIDTNVGMMGGAMPDGCIRYIRFTKPKITWDNMGAWNHHEYWVTDSNHPNKGYKIYAYPKSWKGLTSNPENYVWYRESSGWGGQTEVPVDTIRNMVNKTINADIEPVDGLDPGHVFDHSTRTQELYDAQNYRTNWLFTTEGDWKPYKNEENYWRNPLSN